MSPDPQTPDPAQIVREFIAAQFETWEAQQIHERLIAALEACADAFQQQTEEALTRSDQPQQGISGPDLRGDDPGGSILTPERTARSNQFVDALNHPLDVVLFFETWGQHPDGGCWLVQSKQIDYCAQGKTSAEAFEHFKLGLLSTLALNCDPRFKWPEPCPDKEWNDIIRTMANVQFYRMKLAFESTDQTAQTPPVSAPLVMGCEPDGSEHRFVLRSDVCDCGIIAIPSDSAKDYTFKVSAGDASRTTLRAPATEADCTADQRDEPSGGSR